MLLTLQFRRYLFACLCIGASFGAAAQKDSAFIDGASAEDMEALFSDLERLLDSIDKPKSLTAISLMAGNRLLNVQSSSGNAATSQSFMLSPAVSYNHKSGFGLAGSMSLLSTDGQLKPSQYLATFSYDFMRLRGVFTGIAFTRFMRPDSINYYASPLKNEVSAYALYRKSWFKPSVSLSYGWGTKKEETEQQTLVEALQKKRKKKERTLIPVNTVTSTTESVSDWMVSVSARHDFYFFKVFSKRDNIRLTPQVSFNGGTQQYGFNQTTSTYIVKRSGTVNKPFFSDQVALQEATKFQPLSVTAYLRSAYSKGKFFIQPQLVLDYYIPTTDQNFTASFAVNTGLIF